MTARRAYDRFANSLGEGAPLRSTPFSNDEFRVALQSRLGVPLTCLKPHINQSLKLNNASARDNFVDAFGNNIKKLVGGRGWRHDGKSQLVHERHLRPSWGLQPGSPPHHRTFSRPPPSVGGLDLDNRSSGCARLGGGVGPPLGVVVEEVAVLVVLVRRHRHAVRAAVRRAVDDEVPGAIKEETGPFSRTTQYTI